jgi:hypothetical protein
LSDETEVSHDPFHPDNVQQFILLTLLQIRDFVAVSAGVADMQAYKAVRARHDDGRLMLDWPTLRAGDSASTDSE